MVLIIGILAAVALPQYKLAVVKSRVATILPVMKSIANAEEVYYLQNGSYTAILNKLDVVLPANCTKAIHENHQTCGNDFLFLDAIGGGIVGLYCPHANTSSSDCSAKAVFAIYGFYQHSTGQYQNSWRCSPQNNSEFGKKLCKSITHTLY